MSLSLPPLIVKNIITRIWKIDKKQCLYLAQVSHFFLKVIQSHFKTYKFCPKYEWDSSITGSFKNYVIQRGYLHSVSLLSNIDTILCYHSAYFGALHAILESEQWAEWYAIKRKDVCIDTVSPEILSKFFSQNKYITSVYIYSFNNFDSPVKLPPNLKNLEIYFQDSHYTLEGFNNFMETLNQLSDSVSAMNGTEHVMIERLSLSSPFISQLFKERSSDFISLLNGSRFACLKSLSIHQLYFLNSGDDNDEEDIDDVDGEDLDAYRKLFKVPKEFIQLFIEYLKMNQRKEKRMKSISIDMECLLEKESQELLNEYLLSSESNLKSVHVEMYLDTIPIITNSYLKMLKVQLLLPEQASKGTSNTTKPLSDSALNSLGKVKLAEIVKNFKNIPTCNIRSCRPKLPNKLKSYLYSDILKVNSDQQRQNINNNIEFSNDSIFIK